MLIIHYFNLDIVFIVAQLYLVFKRRATHLAFPAAEVAGEFPSFAEAVGERWLGDTRIIASGRCFSGRFTGHI